MDDPTDQRQFTVREQFAGRGIRRVDRHRSQSSSPNSTDESNPAIAPVSVGANADVAVRGEWLATQRARGTTRGDHALGAQRELARLDRGEEHPHGVGALLGIVEDDRFVELRLADREQFDDDGLRLGVPAEAHRADPELDVQRCQERAEVSELARLGRHRGTEPPVDLLEQETHPIGEHLDLLLLEQHAHHPRVVHGLEIERPVAGFADRPRNKSIRGAKNMYRA